MNLVFYTSGHGLGHATRDIAVIEAIVGRRPDAQIVVCSSVPPDMFTLSTSVAFEVRPSEADTGAVQIDSLHLDEDRTARAAAHFYADFDRRVEAEASVLRECRASVVVGDIPPLAFAAADRAGLPSIAIGNFTWDWIYEAYPTFERLAPGVLAVITRAYSRATRALRLPLHGGFAPMGAAVRDIPLVARKSALGREAARRELAIPSGKPVVLASFGAYGAPLPYETVAAEGRVTLMVTDHEPPQSRALRRFSMPRLAARGLRYQDLVAAADIVVSKPGYGIVSECIANGTALLYTSRGRFAEQEALVAGMRRVLRTRYISNADLVAGRWTDGIDALMREPAPVESMAIDGARVAADEILQVAAMLKT